MPFTFKLSKRLALIKASLVASAALALACDRTDLTSPQTFPSPLTAAVMSLPVVSVVASAHDGNIPQNTLDKNLATRWSAYGDGQWIQYDLGALMAVDRLDIAWYVGDFRKAIFDLEVSPDAVTWTKVFSGQSSGLTTQLETYAFPTASGRYVRVVGHGNSLLTGWISITEVDIHGTTPPPPVSTTLSVASVVASGTDGNVPQNTRDRNLATRWSAYGDGQWIRYDLGAPMAVGRLDIAWYRGNEWASAFEIEVSSDTVTWAKAFAARSSGQTLEPEGYDFPAVTGRYVRITGYGQWSGTAQLSLWNSITEVEIHGTTPPPPVSTTLSVTSVVASRSDGNVPQNTRDQNLATRWSAEGDGQWIRYDLGASMAVDRLDIAWYRGNEWASAFDIDVSPDAVTWAKAFAGRSSGQTLEPEGYDFPAVTGRYVRITGHGQWSGTAQLSLWNSITEVEISGSAAVTVNPVPVASVTVSPASVGVSLGATRQLDAVVKDAHGNVLTGRTVNWATSSSAVAAVSSGGLVTGVAPGSGSITATCEGRSATAAITVAMAEAELAVVSLAASGDDGNIPSNTRDNNLTTRWSAFGDGQWIGYDLGVVATIPHLDIAWYRGNEWASAFEIEVSPDAISWTKAFAGRSSGQTLQPERYDFPTVAGRYVRIVGHGQWSGTTQLSLWSSVTEVGIYGAAVGPVVPLPVASVTVSPASAGLSPGATRQLSAVVKDANGYLLLGPSVTWASSAPAVATVSASGLVTGVAAGTASISATSEGRSAMAAITVTSAGAGPQPGPTALIIFQDGFESGNLSQWGFQSDAGSGRYSVTTNAARVKSGTRSLETLYTPTNTYGMITRWFMPGYDEVYVKFSVMFEEGFQNMRPDGNGMHYFVLAGNNINDSHSSWGKPGVVPNGTDFIYAGLDPEYIQHDPTLRPFSYYTYWPDMRCCYGNVFTQSSPKTALISGQWQEVVFHIKLNTPGQYDGSQTVWINGVKKLDMQNMRWRTTTDVRLNEIRFDNYMGSGSPITEHVWVDDVVVWTP